MRTVSCPETITSPAPSAGFTQATGLGANVRCGALIEIDDDYPDGTPLEVRCPHGHHSFVLAGEDK